MVSETGLSDMTDVVLADTPGAGICVFGDRVVLPEGDTVTFTETFWAMPEGVDITAGVTFGDISGD